MDNQVKLDAHGELLLRQYRELLPTLQKLADEASQLLRHALREQGIYITAMENRVKTEKSLTGKLELKGINNDNRFFLFLCDIIQMFWFSRSFV